MLLPLTAEAKAIRKILLFGDSIIAGYGLEEKDSVPKQLEGFIHLYHPEVEIINGGISGDTTSGGLGRIEWTLDKFKPDLVLVALGANDMLRGVSPDITEKNLDAILYMIRKRNIYAILSRVIAPSDYGPEFQERYHTLFPNLAKKYSVPLYPFLIEKIYGNPKMMLADGVHPNAEGAKLIARDLAIYFGPIISRQRTG